MFDSDSDDDLEIPPVGLGGDALMSSPLPSLNRPAFLYDDDDDDDDDDGGGGGGGAGASGQKRSAEEAELS